MYAMCETTSLTLLLVHAASFFNSHLLSLTVRAHIYLYHWRHTYTCTKFPPPLRYHIHIVISHSSCSPMPFWCIYLQLLYQLRHCHHYSKYHIITRRCIPYITRIACQQIDLVPGCCRISFVRKPSIRRHQYCNHWHRYYIIDHSHIDHGRERGTE